VLDAVVHLFDGFELGETKTRLVRDVVDASNRIGVLAVNTADLKLEIVANLFELGLGANLRQFDMHGGANGGSQVRRAEGEPAEALVTRERHLRLDELDALDEALDNLANVAAVLHRDDAEMVLFVHPDQEGLVFVVEDTTSGWPVAARVRRLQEAISLLEQEVVSDKLVLDLFGHTLKRVVGALEFRLSDGLEDFLDLRFHLEVVGLGQARVEWVALERATATNAGRVDILAFGVEVGEQMGLALAEVDGWLFLVGSEAIMVVLDEGIKQRLEHGVSLSIGGIDTDTRVEIGNAGLDDIQKGGTELGLLVLELINDGFGEIFLQERVAVFRVLKSLVSIFDLLDNVRRSHFRFFPRRK